MILRNKTKSLLAITALVFLYGCNRSEDSEVGATPKMDEQALIEQAKSQIRRELNDPDSARFQNMRWKTKESLVLLCGEVSAKNAFGTYTGYAPFWAAQPGLIEKGHYVPSAPLIVNMEHSLNCN